LKTPVFDRVTVQHDDGSRRTYSAEEFLALPLHDRIRYILARDVEFYRDGTPVDRGLALRSLR
jgi:hypothetical protein